MNGVRRLDRCGLTGVAAAAILGAAYGLTKFAEWQGATTADAFDAVCGLLGFAVLVILGVVAVVGTIIAVVNAFSPPGAEKS